MARTLAPGQRSRIVTLDVNSGEITLVHESSEILYEAPNWSLDGSALYVNGGGDLYRLAFDDDGPRRIDFGDLPELNNDHVLDPDGMHVFVSANDGHIYRAPLASGEAIRVTNDNEDGRLHFLHGVSPDGATLAYIGLVSREDGSWAPANIFTIPAAGGDDTQLTDDEYPDDGSEYSPDGEWIYFNSERANTGAGHAQLFRMRPDGTDQQQLTHDERVNWFPHPSPDGTRLAYVSFPSGTEGHPADRDVIVRICDSDGGNVRDLRHLFGGQGTMNVPSWAPDGTRIAFVEYPIADGGAE
ncbi:TolB family protein [Microbacterium pygmaeum]|uniref:WD40-like Beta Propeller Repeat n=1 Tax=Microbacterium pygmaeum TaxID=370764 RepID=A0A1G7X9I9_9MICO|nr:TolB family protein [Microbacterium pygmaeum]SDG80794.1 WD40-like Beta Propeller Repeat [Microbacterium pygmaeum]